jgi:N-methylhydantoinase B/oxoprolinase/acetone carboxylase alpha subunit
MVIANTLPQKNLIAAVDEHDADVWAITFPVDHTNTRMPCSGPKTLTERQARAGQFHHYNKGCPWCSRTGVALSQGTMNNFTFVSEKYKYYETIDDGSGAGEYCASVDAVQTHMIDSRLTDPEGLEWRYPVRLESHHIRGQSGGAGRWRGRNGAIRRIRFLEPMTASILSNNRVHAPFGVAGGGAGALGRNYVERADGTIVPIVPVGGAQMAAGDGFVVETPGARVGE